MNLNKAIKTLQFISVFVVIQSCAEVIEKDLTKVTVQLSAPVDNLVTSDSVVSFHWEPVESAVNYKLQVVSPAFDSVAKFVADTTIQTNLFYMTLLPGKYQWRMQALNSSSNTSYSTPRNFTIQ